MATTKKPKPSCYILELSVDPGGARRGDVSAYARADHLRKILENELSTPDGGMLPISYGERMILWVVQGGVVSAALDLHPFIRVHWGDRTPCTLDDAKALAPLAERYGNVEEIDDVTFTLDWDAIAIPALEGEPLGIDGTVKLSDPRKLLKKVGSYLVGTDPIPFGYSDLEGGEEPPPTWEDPAPPGRHA